MRIALLSHASSPEGDELGIAATQRDLAAELVAQGHEVTVFEPGTPAASESTLQGGFEVVRYGRAGAVRRLLLRCAAAELPAFGEALARASDGLAALRLALRSGAFDVVEVCGDGVAAGLVGLCDGLPVVVRMTAAARVPANGAERWAWSRLVRLGLRSARTVSVPTNALRNRLQSDALLDRPALVVPDGVPAWTRVEPRSLRAGTPDGAIVLSCARAPRGEVDRLASFLERGLGALPELHVVIGSWPGGVDLAERLRASVTGERVRVDDDAGSRAAFAGADCVLVWGDGGVPRDLLLGMSAGAALLVREVPGLEEVVRDDVDGLTFATDDGADAALRRLCRTPSLRARLGRSAAERAARRFDAASLAARRAEIYAMVSERRAREASSAATDEGIELGPHDWYEAWWLRRTAAVPTRLARGALGLPTLLALPFAELKLVDAVLIRGWCDGPADWAAPEWAELRELGDRIRERLARIHAGEEDGAARVADLHLGLPPVEHPMFDPDRPAALLAESWRLDACPPFVDWLASVVRQRGFVARAVGNVQLRWIAVQCARHRPGPGVFGILRRIYRQPRHRAQVVAADRAFLAAGSVGDGFARGIADLGLHAEFASERFPAPRRRPGAVDLSQPARVTVLVPSYRHEKFVGAAVRSCLCQTLRDVRVLVADDRSPDGTAQVARAIDDPRVRVHVNDRNLGLGASVANALRMVDTPFVALLNSDDLLHPERLERCVAVLEDDPGAALVATRFAVIDRQGRVLGGQSACAVEIGPQALGWIRWFEGVTAGLEEPEDWTAFETLLRHNVLATSSNMVFRREWLAERLTAATDLRYCLDWQLFLQAAAEGALRMVPERLLAYRLHDTNTVWFREGNRADYVMEVNRVVDRVLAPWLDRTADREGGAVAVERLAAILEQDVGRHGETDGMALYLAGLARTLPDGPVDHRARAIAELADAALRRKTYAKVAERIHVDPWSLPWRSEAADRLGLEREVAHAFVSRTKAVESESSRLRVELQGARDEAEDARAARARAERRGAESEQRWREELDRLREQSRQEAERSGQEAERARREYEAAKDRLGRELEAERTARATAEGERDRTAAALEQRSLEVELLTAERADLSVRLDAAHDEGARLGSELAARGRERDGLIGELADARADGARLHAELTELGTERDRLAQELGRTVAERDRARDSTRWTERVRDFAIDALIDERTVSRAERFAELPALAAERPASSVARVSRRGVERLRRGVAHALRLMDHDGRARRRVVVLGGPTRRVPSGWRALLEVCGTPELDARLVAWVHETPPELLREVAQELERAGRQPCRWLAEDPDLGRADRRYFERRMPSAVIELEALAGGDPAWVARACRTARLAKTVGAGVAVVHGLGSAAALGLAAQRLCGIPYVLVVADEELASVEVGGAMAASVVRSARCVLVDSDPVLDRLQEVSGTGLTEVLVRPALSPFPVAPPPARSAGDPLRIAVPWSGWCRADPATLFAGVRAALDRGVDIQVDLFGEPRASRSGFRHRFELEAVIRDRGLQSRLRWHRAETIDAQRAAFAQSHVTAWVGVDAPACGVPAGIGESLAAGRPVIASAVDGIRARPDVRDAAALVPPGDVAAFTEALVGAARGDSGATERSAIDRGGLEQRWREAHDALPRALRRIFAPDGPNR